MRNEIRNDEDATQNITVKIKAATYFFPLHFLFLAFNMFDNNCLPFNCTFVFIKCDYLVKKKNIISRTYITRNLPLP